MSYSAGNGDLGPHKHHAHHYGPTSNLFSKICEMASRLVDDARQSAEWQMRRLDGAPCMAVSVVVVVRLNLVNVGQLWEMPPGSLRNCLWQSVVVTLLYYALFFAISQVFGTTGNNADVRVVAIKVHKSYISLII